MGHNQKEVIQQLQSILSNPSKKIGFLFGAGISMKDKGGNDLIEGVKKMTESIIAKFSSDPKKSAIEKMKAEITSSGKLFNIETLLSKISEKERGAGDEKLCGLTCSELEKLRKEIENEIKTMVSVHNKTSGKIDAEKTNHNTLAKWIKNANREHPVEIFTTNYDYLTELGLERQKIPYFDGFIGNYNAFFCPEWIEDDSNVKGWTKLWKMHGSLGWARNEYGEIVRTFDNEESAMIYPSFLKYDHSRKQPYLSYMDRLSYFLKQPDSVLIVCGYSFGDDHINEMILTALSRSRSSSVFVLEFKELKEEDPLSSEIAKESSKISVYAKKTAVIGCKFDNWNIGNDFLLGDFKEFTSFLYSFL